MELSHHEGDWLQTRLILYFLFVSLHVVDALEVVLSEWLNVSLFLSAHGRGAYELEFRVTKLKLVGPPET